MSLEYSMNTKLLAKHHLEPLSLKGGCIGSSESTLVKIHCWKSLVKAPYVVSCFEENCHLCKIAISILQQNLLACCTLHLLVKRL